MEDVLLEYEPEIRMGCFIGIFTLVGLWEVLSPRRRLTFSRMLRWPNNLGLVVLNTSILRLLFPGALVGMATWVNGLGWGLLAYHDMPLGLAIVVGIVALDLLIWVQHVLVHAVPVLWRLHRVHHADPDYDLTTGLRFHPLEILLSMSVKSVAILLLGPPVAAVVLFEVILNGMAVFNHANGRLPIPLDRLLRLFVVTPDMHRVHHSVEDDEANSNFGFNLSIWDRLFGTYRAAPRGGHGEMVIGIRGCRDPRRAIGLPGLLILPFLGPIHDYAINRRQWAVPFRDGGNGDAPWSDRRRDP